MEERSVFVTFNDVKLTFHLFDQDVNDAMVKKLSKMGVPDIAFNWPASPTDKFLEISNGLYKQGDFECEGVSITSTTKGATCICVFDPASNVIVVTLNGEFFCFNSMDDDVTRLSGQTFGFVEGARFRDAKGKLVKKPKDQWGMSDPLVAKIVKNSYEGESQRVAFTVTVKPGDYIPT